VTDLAQRTLTALPLFILFTVLFWYTPPLVTSIVLAAALIYILLVEWPRLLARCSRYFWLITPLYPVLPFVLLILLNQDNTMRIWLFTAMLLVIGYDTGAYLIGSLIGTHKLAPTLSPGKTWEGCAGGYGAACGVSLLINTYWSLPITYNVFFVTALICIAAQLGDLFESWLKRRAGVKDSGSLLPGHGGLLDRFDSLLFVSVLLYVGKYFLPG